MAIPRIKSTYSLDVETVRSLDGVAKRWKVSKSEALRRVIRAAAEEAGPQAADALGVLDTLQATAGLSAKEARAWAAGAQAERRAASARRLRASR
jgi:hypothetical protein